MKKSEVWEYVPKHSAVLMSCFAMKKVKSLSGVSGLPLPLLFFSRPEVYVDITMKAAKEMLGAKLGRKSHVWEFGSWPNYQQLQIIIWIQVSVFIWTWIISLCCFLVFGWGCYGCMATIWFAHGHDTHKWIGSRKFKHFNLWEALSLFPSIYIYIRYEYIHIMYIIDIYTKKTIYTCIFYTVVLISHVIQTPQQVHHLNWVVRNDLTVEQHSRESIRIARIARELLKKFAAAFRLFQNMDDEEGGSIFKNTVFAPGYWRGSVQKLRRFGGAL